MKKKSFTKKKNIYQTLIDFDIIIYINVTKNNIIISITNLEGKIIEWFSSGCLKLKGFRKSSPLAAKLLANSLFDRVSKYEIKSSILKIKGRSYIKKMLLKYISLYDLKIIKLVEISTIPFNGCKAQKRRKL